MRRFQVEFRGTVEIELHESVIDVVDDEWRAAFYNLRTPEDIARHIAFNLVINGIFLSSMDGWGNKINSDAQITKRVGWTADVKELPR